MFRVLQFTLFNNPEICRTQNGFLYGFHGMLNVTAQAESHVANSYIAQGKTKCYICQETVIKSCVFYTNEAAVLSLSAKVLTKIQFFGHFSNTFIE